MIESDDSIWIDDNKIQIYSTDDRDYYEYTDNKLKSNKRYYYKLYRCSDKQYSNTESYWTTVKPPKGGQKIRKKNQMEKGKGSQWIFSTRL